MEIYFSRGILRQHTTDLGLHQANVDILEKLRKRRESSADITVVRKMSESHMSLQNDLARLVGAKLV